MPLNLLNTFSSRSAILCVCALLASSLISSAQTASSTPTNTPIPSATINVDSGCTINQAITSANSNSTPSGSTCEAGTGNDIINISGTHTLTAHLPEITSTITIVGSGNATIDGATNKQMFNLDSNAAQLTVRNLVIRNGGGRSYGGAFTMSNGPGLTIENSSIHNNRAAFDGGISGTSGGLTVRNTTFYNNWNWDNRSQRAQAVHTAGTTVTLIHVTISGHRRGIGAHNNARINLRNSIVTNSTGADCATSTGGSLSITTSIIEDNTCSPTTSGDPKLGAWTGSYFVPNSDSPAINAATTSLCTSADQIGTTRPQGASCDIGAIEVTAAVLTATPTSTNSPVPSNTPVPSGTPLPSSTPTNSPVPSNTPTDTPVPSATPTGTWYSPTPQPGRPAATSEPRDGPRAEEAIAPPTPIPVIHTGLTFFDRYGIRVSATYGLRSGVQFKRIGADGIGLPEVLSNGFIDAVDVFGYVEQGVEVCFPQYGALIFLDAATSPRSIIPWPSTIVDGMTCGLIDRPGTLVLVPLGSRLAGPVATSQPAPALQSPRTSQTSQTALQECYVRTTHILNVRSGPGGEIIGLVDYDVTLSARAKDGAWYQISVDGLVGWISADFVRTRGSCG